MHTHYMYCLHIHFARPDLMMIGGNMYSRFIRSQSISLGLSFRFSHYPFLQISAREFVRIVVNRSPQPRSRSPSNSSIDLTHSGLWLSV